MSYQDICQQLGGPTKILGGLAYSNVEAGHKTASESKGVLGFIAGRSIFYARVTVLGRLLAVAGTLTATLMLVVRIAQALILRDGKQVLPAIQALAYNFGAILLPSIILNERAAILQDIEYTKHLVLFLIPFGSLLGVFLMVSH